MAQRMHASSRLGPSPAQPGQHHKESAKGRDGCGGDAPRWPLSMSKPPLPHLETGNTPRALLVRVSADVT